MYSKKFPKSVTFKGTNDEPKCMEILKKAFCAGFPQNNPCPIEGGNVNILLPDDKTKPINVTLFVSIILWW